MIACSSEAGRFPKLAHIDIFDLTNPKLSQNVRIPKWPGGWSIIMDNSDVALNFRVWSVAKLRIFFIGNSPIWIRWIGMEILNTLVSVCLILDASICAIDEHQFDTFRIEFTCVGWILTGCLQTDFYYRLPIKAYFGGNSNSPFISDAFTKRKQKLSIQTL